jgi:alpha-D-ribose 1-methylphosphonate 5-triphosphate synthase subunit PhnH
MSAVMESSALAELAPAFAEPVHDAQAVFRVLLEAMSRPGRVQMLPAQCRDTLGRPEGIAPALAAALLTLLDADTALWIAPALDTPPLRAWIRFHCGAALVEQPERADFALLAASEATPALLQRLNAGSDVAPQDSATALIAVDAIDADQAAQCWRGPGISDEHRLAIAGPSSEFWNWRREQQQSFPCGLDFVFAAGDRLVALPRSTTIVEIG